MIRIEHFIQLKAFARQDAIILSLLWTLSLACTMLLGAASIGNLLVIATPFVVGWRLIRFRNDALEGVISLRRAFAYCAYTFFYASLVFAIVQFAYFQFLDKGALADMVCQTITALIPVYKQQGISMQQINESINVVRMLTPIQWSFMFMLQNMIIGTLLSLPIAIVGKRNIRARR